MSNLQNNPHASAYAKSLLELATEKGEAEAIGAELTDVRQLLLENKAFELYLHDPSVGVETRLAMMKNVFGGRMNPLILRAIGVMNSKGRLGDLGAVCDAYDELLDQQLGKIEVDVTVAAKLNNDELEQVRQKISQGLKRDAVVHQYVDESIIGGVIIRVQDQVIDGSVRKQLETLRRKMLAGK